MPDRLKRWRRRRGDDSLSTVTYEGIAAKAAREIFYSTPILGDVLIR